MAKFYSVVTAFYDNGRVSSFLGDVVEADVIPENTFKCLRDRDLYVDWFASEEEATEFKKSALKA